jgi:hypothetical protein
MSEQTKPHLNLVRLSDVEIQPIHWLWKRRIPLGKLSILQGKGAMGKSFISMDLAARITTGRAMPHELDPQPVGNVLYFSIEDDPADTHLPRLLAAEGDPERFIVSKATLHYDDDGEPIKGALSLAHTNEIREALVVTEPRLLVIDPVTSFLGGAVDMHRANEVRPVLEALGDLAQEAGVAILMILHVNKGGVGGAMYRGLGSVDFANTARSVLITGEHEGRPILAHAKMNVTQKAPSIHYQISNSHIMQGGDAVGCITWEEETNISADELETDTRGKPGPAPTVDQLDVENHILKLLERPISAASLEQRARNDLGAAKHAFERARGTLRNAGKIDFRRVGFGNDSTVYWHRANTEPEDWQEIEHRHLPNPGEYE